MKWSYLLVLGSTGCLTIHVHVPSAEPMYLSPYPYATAPVDTGVPRPGETSAVRRPIDESLEDDQRLAAAPPGPPSTPVDPKPRPARNQSCEPPYRITPQGIRVMRAECITE